MNGITFKGTVTLSKSLGGPKVVRYRQHGHAARDGIDMIPYKLAEWLELMPTPKREGYRNQFYQFTNEQLEALETCERVKKITKTGGRFCLTVEIP